MGQTHRKDGIAYGFCERCGEKFEKPARGVPYFYCSRKCSVEPLAERLLRGLVRGHASDSCLEWSGKRNRDGYGELQHEKRTLRVHRLMWVVHVGDIPKGLKVCHKCDNPACARLDHLFLGTHADNMRDMARKGRGVYPEARGERHGAAKLNDDTVRRIRADRRSQTAIAQDFGVAQSLVSQIKRRKIWRHLSDEVAA